MSAAAVGFPVGAASLDPSGVALGGAAVEGVVDRHDGGAAGAQEVARHTLKKEIDNKGH